MKHALFVQLTAAELVCVLSVAIGCVACLALLADEMSLPKQQRMVQLLEDSSNWLGQGKPDAILFSAGGDDIAGDKLCIFLDDAASSANGL
jgi:hypothetical protein